MVTPKSLSFSEEDCINRASRNFTKFGDGKPWTFVTSDSVVAQLFVQYVLFKLDTCRLEESDIHRASQGHRSTTMNMLYLQTRWTQHKMIYDTVK